MGYAEVGEESDGRFEEDGEALGDGDGGAAAETGSEISLARARACGI